MVPFPNGRQDKMRLSNDPLHERKADHDPVYRMEPVVLSPSPAQGRRRVLVPAMLFVATCVSTYLVGGLAFSLTLMTTLTCHEMGHFLQARRYRVAASWPYFIPMPFSPIGTMGAVIGMQARMGDRKSLFDIGITGPLAGLGPALVFCYFGLSLSQVVPVTEPSLRLGEPLIFKWLVYWMFGSLAEGQDVLLHPIAFGGWVGIFITALNLIPIGQLDGGHVLYALLPQKAHAVAKLLLLAATAAVIIGGYWGWTVMLFLLILIGPTHPPTANDHIPLGRGRIILGWLSLLFVIVGFTPTPFLL